MEKITSRNAWRWRHIGGAVPLEGQAPSLDLLILERRRQVVGEPVSDLPHKPEIVADGSAYQTETVGSSGSISIRSEWLIIPQQFRNFLRIIDEEVDEDVLKKRIKESRTHDHKAAVILFFVLEEPREFKERVFKRKMPFQILSRNPGGIIIASLILVGCVHAVSPSTDYTNKLACKDTGNRFGVRLH